jgi:hypothetical protein
VLSGALNPNPLRNEIMARSSTSVCATRLEKLKSDNAVRNKSRFIIIEELEKPGKNT